MPRITAPRKKTNKVKLEEATIALKRKQAAFRAPSRLVQERTRPALEHTYFEEDSHPRYYVIVGLLLVGIVVSLIAKYAGVLL